MATNFPSSLDVFTNPTSTSSMSGALSHAGQHSDVNDAIEALQAKVGADSSAVASSHDYKIADHESRLTMLEGAPAAGLTLIKKVTFSGVTSFSEDNVFTSTYDNYLILISHTTSSNSDTNLRLRAGGVDSSGSNYIREILFVNATTVTANTSTSTEFNIGNNASTRSHIITEIFEPAVAIETGIISRSQNTGSRNQLLGGYHNLTTAYDGFTILDNVGNITGTLWLYGYDKD